MHMEGKQCSVLYWRNPQQEMSDVFLRYKPFTSLLALQPKCVRDGGGVELFLAAALNY